MPISDKTVKFFWLKLRNQAINLSISELISAAELNHFSFSHSSAPESCQMRVFINDVLAWLNDVFYKLFSLFFYPTTRLGARSESNNTSSKRIEFPVCHINCTPRWLRRTSAA